MTDQERAEYNSLVARANSLTNQINSVRAENNMLVDELNYSYANIPVLINNCIHMGNAVYGEMDNLSKHVAEEEIQAQHVFDAMNQLRVQYFTFKNISTASKNMTQYTDEYSTKYSFYNELRRISLGYVVAIDSHIISGETARKKVEKAYLQNTDYWLAYAMSAVMLWANDEKEAATRAMNKSLSMNYFKSCLFYLLINLRFVRVETAKKWYINYLERTDATDLGDEWKHLLHAYLLGVFGSDTEFQNNVLECFKKMLSQMEATTVDFGRRIIDRATEYAQTYINKTANHYDFLRRTCGEYENMLQTLSSAEKNAILAKDYNTLADVTVNEGEDLAQRIENVLYALVSSYDDEELKIVKKLKYNEAIVAAKGDFAAAQARYNFEFPDDGKKKSLGDLLLNWAFDISKIKTDVIIKRFAISFFKERIIKGFEAFAERYRQNEQAMYTVNIDGCIITCDENDYDNYTKTINDHYDTNKTRNTLNDKHVRAYGAVSIIALLILILMPFMFNVTLLTIGVLFGAAGGFLLWRRIKDMEKILAEKKRLSLQLFKNVLTEMGQWRQAYKEADSKHGEFLNAVNRF